MKGKVVIATDMDGRELALVFNDGVVSDVFAANPRRADLSGMVVQAKVTRMLPGQKAAIVSWRGEAGKESGYASPLQGKRGGESLLLQIKANARGAKLPSLNADIALPGRFLIHLPLGRGVHFSKRMSESIAARLKQQLGDLPRPGGWVVRQAAGAASAEQLAHEAAYLAGVWKDKAEGAIAIRPNNTVQHAIVEHADCEKIIVPNKAAHKKLCAWLEAAAPDLLGHAEADKPPASIDLDALMAGLLGAEVPLAGGGTLIIQETAALTVVDVNAADRNNYLQVNLCAAEEVARQIRLRNLGGMIVVDFIRLPKQAERDKVLQKLRTAVAGDSAGVEIFGYSRMGLVEMTRVRRGQPLSEVMGG
ncbi:MAG: hypothetical protein GC131_04015 [Alphaproteobacteria bacterium]|nr:hypothetical protein [Alphaproteobacteria bacterium]